MRHMVTQTDGLEECAAGGTCEPTAYQGQSSDSEGGSYVQVELVEAESSGNSDWRGYLVAGSTFLHQPCHMSDIT